MLDNNDINEQLANEAWERMRLLLDAEMPVAEDRRKRPVFWIWSKTAGIAATLLFSALGIWWLASDTTLTPAGNAALAGEFNRPAFTPETSLTEAPQTDAQTQQTFVPEQTDEAATTGLNNASTHKSRFDALQLYKSTPANSPFLKSDALPFAKEGALLPATTPGPENAVIVAEAETSEFPSSGFIQQYPAASQLPGLELKTSAVEMPAMHATAIPMDKLATSWRHGPELGGIVSFPTSLGGFHAGWAAEMPIAEGLALRGALRYDFQRQTVSRNDRQATFESSSNFFPADPFNPVADLGTAVAQPDTVISSTLKMHYAALPLSLSLKLNDRWSVEGGVQVAYLFQAFRESRNSALSSLNTNGTGIDFGSNNVSRSWYFSNKAQEVAAESFQPWDLALSGGFRYQLSRHWNVGVSGNFGLLNQANKANGYRVFNRNSVLSLGYNF